jgi:hypothetical protein
MHLALARVLTTQSGSELQVADHLFAADPGGRSDETTIAARAAARTAIERLSYEEAVLFAARVVEAEERRGRRGGLVSALVVLAEAKMLAGDASGCTDAAERALALARDDDDTTGYARAALALGHRPTFGIPDPALMASLQEALARMDRSTDEDLALRCAVEGSADTRRGCSEIGASRTRRRGG